MSEQLDELSERLQSISLAIDETIWDHDIVRNTIRYNERMSTMFGYEVDNIDGAVSWWYNNLHPDDIKKVKSQLSLALDNKVPRIEMNYRYRCADGKYKPVYDRALILRNENDIPVRMIGVMQDMSHMIDLEKQRNRLRDTVLRVATDEKVMSGRDMMYSLNTTLKESAHVLKSDLAGVWLLNSGAADCIAAYQHGHTVSPSDRPLPLPGIIESIIGSESRYLVYDIRKSSIDLLVKDTYYLTHDIQAAVLQLIRVKGVARAILVFEVTGEPRNWSSDELQFISTMTDQMAQIFANAEIIAKDQQLEQTLREKETLLQEIHHRVKNNLAVVSSLMQLQAFESTNDEVKEQLLDSAGRVRSMALIHEELYQNENFSYLDIQETIKGLTKYSASIMQGDASISTHFNLEEIRVNINQAVPLSLIINEVVTNIYKHAFIGMDGGTIRITTCKNDQDFHIEIADDGVGFPPDFDFNSITSMGMQLIHTLTEQLNGRYTLSNAAKGARFTLFFNLQDIKGAHSSL